MKGGEIVVGAGEKQEEFRTANVFIFTPHRTLTMMTYIFHFIYFITLQNQTHVQQNANQNHQIAAKMGRGKGQDAKPRGRMTAYAFFVQTCREEHKKKHPEESVIFAEFSRKCAERWKVREPTFYLLL